MRFFSNQLKQLSVPAIFAIALMPAPSHLTFGQGELPVDASFSVAYSGGDARVKAAAERLVANLSKHSGIPMAPDASRPRMEINCGAAGKTVQEVGEDESYRLIVTTEKATLSAANPLGVIRGLATFEQLVGPAKAPGAKGFAAATVTIEDGPRFPWRGLHIDVSRHWIPVPVILRNLDGMWAVKLNVFHWHLSDNQGFRIESKLYPKLQGSGSDGLFYTQEQVRSVIAYARDRGIRVVPEFDVPGHSTSWLAGYPELGASPGPFQIGRTWGVFDPVMDPTGDYTYEFLDKFIGEMAGLFPDAYFHIGGDEVNGKAWNESARIMQFKKDHGMQAKDGTPTKKDLTLSNEKLQAYFNERVLGIVKKHGKKMMGWDEILAPELPKDIVIQSWRGQDSLAAAVQQGFQGVLSSGYYLDHMDSSAVHYSVDPLIDPKTKKPLPLTAAQSAHILGGEVCMWSEYVTAENIDSRIWPRTAAVAERFWSPQQVADPKDMYTRLDRVSVQLEWYGLTHRSSYTPMLERLAGGQPVQALRTLADVETPVGLGGRARAGKYTQSTPLNRFVDAARPESVTARRFADSVAAGEWAEVRAMLSVWKENDAKLKPILENGILKEIAPVSAVLSQAASIGLEAVDSIETKKPPTAEWKARAKQVLTDAQKPKAEVSLAIVAPVQKLVEMAGQ